ncbi:MAG: sigma-70 family RNA polymerase sigma factor [Planctomycetota bacterium]
MAANLERSKPPQRVGLTSEELARRVQGGSEASFAELVNRFGPRLFHYFQQKIFSREDCEDLVQDTLVKAYRNIHLYQISRPFGTWIFTIGTRRMVDFFRTQGRKPMTSIPQDLPAESNPFDSAVRREKKRNLWAHARSLPGRQFEALWLRYAEEMSIKEIAQVLGMSCVHVKVILFRARNRLAKLQPLDGASQDDKDHGEVLKEMLSCR